MVKKAGTSYSHYPQFGLVIGTGSLFEMGFMAWQYIVWPSLWYLLDYGLILYSGQEPPLA